MEALPENRTMAGSPVAEEMIYHLRAIVEDCKAENYDRETVKSFERYVY